MKQLIRHLTLVLIAAMTMQLLPATGHAQSSHTPKLNDNGLAVDVEDGAILHTWCWSYATVKENISEIAAAGFSAIQVSPLSLCKEGGKQINGGWYWHYQPVDYESFGNYQMGTLEDFKAMCQEAHKYGLKVIVDTVINHCTSDHGAIADSITGGFDGQAFHDHKASNWSEVDRYEETQFPLSGLYDWNTQRQDVQDYLKTFLMKCVEYGADGFRYDAAKLIELPDDTSKKYGSDFASNFWPYVLQNGASFQYGEVLQEGGKHEYDQGADAKSGYDDSDSSRLGAYQALSFTAPDGHQQQFFTTASYYGFRVRDCVSSQSLAVDRIGDFLMPKGATAQQAVTWVESHDNYCNNASYNQLSDQQVIQGWAILAARAGGTPLFYSRPNNSSASNPWGDNVIGPAGSDMYKNPQVVAVNYFGNEMGDDAPEYLSNPMGDTSVLMIERGTKEFAGCVIVNSGNQDIVLKDVPVKAMADGTYQDAAYGGTFTVTGGKLSGTVKAGMVAVVYRSRITSRVSFQADAELSEPSQEFLTDTLRTTINLRNCASAAYQIDEGAWIPCENGTTLTFGENMSADDAVTVKVAGYDEGGNVVAQAQATYTKRVAHGQTIAYFDSRAYPDWDNIYVYVYSNTGNNGGWPGVKPEHLGNGLYRYVLPFTLESAAGLHIMWTNNGTKTQGDTELPMSPKTSMIYKADRTWVPYDGSLAGIGLSQPSGIFRESFQVTITAVDLIQASYTLGDGAPVDCSAGAVVSIDIDALAPGQSITLSASGTDADGKVYSAQAVYTKSTQTENTKVYLDTALYPDWTAPFVYLWASGVKEYAPWPGIAMTDEGNGVYSFELPAELDGKTMNVIFSNNGSSQHPDVKSEPGTQMILTAEGKWTAYVPMPEPPVTEPSVPSEPSEPTIPSEPTVPSEPAAPTETAPASTPAPGKAFPIGLVLAITGSLCLAGALTFFLLKKRKK